MSSLVGSDPRKHWGRSGEVEGGLKGRQPSYQTLLSPAGELREPVQKAQLKDIPMEGLGSWDHYPLTPIHQETRALRSLSLPTNSCLVYQRLKAAPRETNFPSLSFSPCLWAECGSETTKKVKESQLPAIGNQASGTSKYKGIWAGQHKYVPGTQGHEVTSESPFSGRLEYYIHSP